MAFRSSSVFINIFAVIFIISDTRTLISCSEDASYLTNSYKLLSNDLDFVPLERYKRQTSDNGTATTSMPQTTGASSTPTSTWNADDFDRIHDYHSYYESQMITASEIDEFWVELINVTGHQTLSDSHRTAVTAQLPFNFPFYGHYINNVTIATGGFLYVSPFIHKFLTATQYIAPLMANFDTKTGGVKSTVLYTHVGSRFVVEWRDVYLQDQNTTAFRFQAILHSNGSIVFVYKNLPLPIRNISSKAHPVKIGLSDAFYVDTTTFGTKRRTIYEYHRVALDIKRITTGSVVMLHPLPTCNLYTDCEMCVSANIRFECKWCGIVRRCSDSIDWYRQEWLNAGCVHLAGSANCSLIPTAAPPTPKSSGRGTEVAVIIIIVVIVVGLITGLGIWIYYAYSHPTSASGMWLMEHRPSQMKAKINNMKFWKRNTSSGDKYAIESTA